VLFPDRDRRLTRLYMVVCNMCRQTRGTMRINTEVASCNAERASNAAAVQGKGRQSKASVWLHRGQSRRQCGFGRKPSTAMLRVALGMRTLMPSSSWAALTWQPRRDLRTVLLGGCWEDTLQVQNSCHPQRGYDKGAGSEARRPPGLSAASPSLALSNSHPQRQAAGCPRVCQSKGQVQHVVLVIVRLGQLVVVILQTGGCSLRCVRQSTVQPAGVWVRAPIYWRPQSAAMCH
jgi:hypothetical protein